MQEVGKSTDFPKRLIDRRVDIVAKPLRTADIFKLAPYPHYVQACGDQMLARRVVKIGCNPLLHFFLKRQQPDAEISCGSFCGIPLDGIALLLHGTVATNQTNNCAAFGVTDGSDGRLKISSASAKGETMLKTDPPFFSKTCFAGCANRLRGFVTQTVGNFLFADVVG